MRKLVLADLRARSRSLAAIAGGLFCFSLVTGATYRAFGANLGDQLFGSTTPAGIAAFSGSKTAELFSPRSYIGFAFNHPIVMVLTFAIAITIGVNAVAGDVESGRAQLLFSRPVARSRIMLSRIGVWATAQVLVTIVAVVGILAGTVFAPALREVGIGRLVALGVQQLSLSTFIAGVAFVASAKAPSKGVALGATIGVATLGYIVNFVSLVVEPAAVLHWFTPFGYYEPVAVVGHGVQWLRALALYGSGGLLLALSTQLVRTRDLA